MRFTLTLIGLTAAAVLSVLCWLVQGPLIEQKLAEEVGQALGAAQVSGVGVTMDGRDLVLGGTVTSTAVQRQAIEAAESVPGLRLIRSEIKIARPEPPTPELSATRLATGRVAVQGTLADVQSQARLLERARALLGESQVVDQTQVASGGVDNATVDQLIAALPYIAVLQGGQALSTAKQLTLRGQAPELSYVMQTRASLERALPDTELILALDRSWTEADFQVTVTRIGNGLRLEGAVANLSQHTELVQRASELWGKEAVDDQLVVASLAEAPDRTRCLRSAMTRLPELQGGVLTQSADGLQVRGAVASAGVREALETRLASDCGAQSLDVVLPKALPTRECQARVNAMLIGEPIRFQSGQAEIAAISDVDLVRLADTLRACPGPALQITGHTDTVGDPQANLRLSQQRADAVRQRLIELELPPERIQAQGLGETQPVASNSIPVGRAKNRRIEFTLIEPAP